MSDDQSTAADLRDQAIEKVAENANAQWMKDASWAVLMMAYKGGEFTTDDILAAYPQLEGVREPRAWGAIMRQAAVGKTIVATGRYKASTRRKSHARPKMVWRSLVGPTDV